MLTLYSDSKKSMLLKPLACPTSKARGRSYIMEIYTSLLVANIQNEDGKKERKNSLK